MGSTSRRESSQRAHTLRSGCAQRPIAAPWDKRLAARMIAHPLQVQGSKIILQMTPRLLVHCRGKMPLTSEQLIGALAWVLCCFWCTQGLEEAAGSGNPGNKPSEAGG